LLFNHESAVIHLQPGCHDTAAD